MKGKAKDESEVRRSGGKRKETPDGGGSVSARAGWCEGGERKHGRTQKKSRNAEVKRFLQRKEREKQINGVAGSCLGSVCC